MVWTHLESGWSTNKKSTCGKMDKKRSLGRPRTRWIYVVAKDVKAIELQ